MQAVCWGIRKQITNRDVIVFSKSISLKSVVGDTNRIIVSGHHYHFTGRSVPSVAGEFGRLSYPSFCRPSRSLTELAADHV